MTIDVKQILSSRHNVARVTRWLHTADKVLDSMFKAREGSRLSQGLAVAGAVGAVLDALVPERSPHDQLLDMGYKPLSLGLGEFFCGLLQQSDLPSRQLQLSAASSLVLWSVDSTESVAAIYNNDSYTSGPYSLGGDPRLAQVALRSVAWEGSHDLMLDTVNKGNTYVLQEINEPGVYFGVPGLEWFVDRLRRHEGETRSMLLVGPTGVGKSTLGRLISREIDGGKLIKVGARVIRNCSVTDLIEVAEFLSPDVLLLDDISMVVSSHRPDEGNNGQMLELMEGLHGKARLVVATLMLEPDRGGGGIGRYVTRSRFDSGNDHFDGMRPGRVDEVVRIKRPSPQIREKILLHYLGGEAGLIEHKVTKKALKDMVKRTEGLTGAYLKEVAHRVKIHGIKTYRGEIKSILQAAPTISREGRTEARGFSVRRRGRGRQRRKSVQEKRADELALKNEALEAKLEAAHLKLKAAKKR